MYWKRPWISLSKTSGNPELQMQYRLQRLVFHPICQALTKICSLSLLLMITMCGDCLLKKEYRVEWLKHFPQAKASSDLQLFFCRNRTQQPTAVRLGIGAALFFYRLNATDLSRRVEVLKKRAARAASLLYMSWVFVCFYAFASICASFALQISRSSGE